MRGVVRTVLMAASLTNNQRHRPRQQSDSGAWVITSTRLTSTVGTTSQAVTMILPASLVPSVDQNVLTMEGYQNVDQNVDQAADQTSIVTTTTQVVPTTCPFSLPSRSIQLPSITVLLIRVMPACPPGTGMYHHAPQAGLDWHQMAFLGKESGHH